MATICINIPDELVPFQHDLEYFVSTMVRKLHTNRHKGTNLNLDPSVMVLAAEKEIKEVWEAMANEGQFETAVECVDVANFMFLASRGLWQLTRADFERLREDEDKGCVEESNEYIYKYKYWGVPRKIFTWCTSWR